MGASPNYKDAKVSSRFASFFLFIAVRVCLSLQTFDIYRVYVWRETRLPSSVSEFKLLNTFKFIKVVSDTVFEMINAVYRDKPLIFIGPMFREKLVSLTSPGSE